MSTSSQTRPGSPSAEPKSFSASLRWWRGRRGVSQLDLAGAAGISQRHLSFLETDRTVPSQEMVLRIAAALDLPLRQQTALLRAAGFASYWRERPLAAADLAQINRALDYMLAQQEPFPAFVVDRRWNLMRANDGAVRLTRFLTGAEPAGEINLADVLISPEGLRPLIVNWEEVALQFLRSVHADALIDGTSETAELLGRLSSYPAVPSLAKARWIEEPAGPVLNIHFRKDATDLRLFTTITTLGTPQDVTLQEIRIECFFPADAPTERFFRNQA